jgi:hypothetical protein
MAGTNGTMPADIPDFVQEAEEAMARGEMLPGMEESEEVTIKFGKGLVGEPFTSKKGTTLVEVKIPNADPADKTPWASFVISPKMIHDNKFGKGVWMKLPANDMIRVGKPVLEGQTPEGKNIWKREYRQVTASELKEMVETYKTRDKASVLGDLEAKKDAAVKQPKKTKTKTAEKQKASDVAL